LKKVGGGKQRGPRWSKTVPYVQNRGKESTQSLRRGPHKKERTGEYIEKKNWLGRENG